MNYFGTKVTRITLFEVHCILEDIRNTSSDKGKEQILIQNSGNKLLEAVLYLSNSPRVKYYIKQVPEIVASYEQCGDEPIQALFVLLRKLSERSVSGNLAKGMIDLNLITVDKISGELFRQIILKDLRLGVGAKTINKAFKKLIETTPYMGATSFDRKLVEKLIDSGELITAQVKADGCYSNTLTGDVEMVSRQGESQDIGDCTLTRQLKTIDPDLVLNGELTIRGIKDRAAANGLITSLIDYETKKDSRTEEDNQKRLAKFEKSANVTLQEIKDRVVYTVWDCITLSEYLNQSSSREYIERFRDLKVIVDRQEVGGNIELVVQKPFNPKKYTSIEECYNDILSYYKECVDRGEEGIILKSTRGLWVSGKPNYQLKFKEEIHLDLEIIGFKYGNGKNKDVISSLKVQSSDGLLLTDPSGLTEEEMRDFTANQEAYLGKIVEIKCYGITQNKKGTYSALHPVFIEKRFDKDTADCLEDCLKIVDSINSK